MNMNSVEGFNTDNEVKNSSYLNTLDKSELLKVTITDVVQGFVFFLVIKRLSLIILTVLH